MEAGDMIDLDAVMDGGLDAVVDTGVGNASVPATAATQEEERARSGKAKPKEGGTVLHSGQDFQCPDCRTISTELWKPSHFMDFPLCSICQELEVNCVYASCQHAKTCDRCALQFGAGASSTHSGDGAAGSGAGDPPTKKPKIDDLRSKKNKSHVEQFDREIHTSISGLRALHPCDFKDLDSSMAARHWRGDFLPQVAIDVMVGRSKEGDDYGDLKMKAWTQHLHRVGALADKNEKGGVASSERAHYGYPTLEGSEAAGLYPGSRYTNLESQYLKNNGQPSAGIHTEASEFYTASPTEKEQNSRASKFKKGTASPTEITVAFSTRFSSIPDVVARISSESTNLDLNVELELVEVSTTCATFVKPAKLLAWEAAAAHDDAEKLNTTESQKGCLVSYSAAERGSYQIVGFGDCDGVYSPTSQFVNGLTVYTNEHNCHLVSSEEGWRIVRGRTDGEILRKIPASAGTAHPPYESRAKTKECRSFDLPPVEAEGSGWGPKSGVWRIENIKDLAPVDKKEWGQFYAGDSYVVCYTYKTPGGKEAAFIYFWQGVESTQDEKAAAEIQATDLADEIGSYAEKAKVEMNKEPPHFYKIFEGKFVVHGGGIGSGFENVDQADYYDTDGVRLFQICGTNDWNIYKKHVVQVAEKSSSLNSTDAFILETPTQLYAWFGKDCNEDERDFAKKIAPKLHGLTTKNKHPESISEGMEPADFWEALGGKQAIEGANGRNYGIIRVVDKPYFSPALNRAQSGGTVSAPEVTEDKCPCESVQRDGTDCNFCGTIDEVAVHLREVHRWNTAVRTLHSWERRGSGSLICKSSPFQLNGLCHNRRGLELEQRGQQGELSWVGDETECSRNRDCVAAGDDWMKINWLPTCHAKASIADPFDASGPLSARVDGHVVLVEWKADADTGRQALHAEQAGATAVVFVAGQMIKEDESDRYSVVLPRHQTCQQVTIPVYAIHLKEGNEIMKQIGRQSNVQIGLQRLGSAGDMWQMDALRTHDLCPGRYGRGHDGKDFKKRGSSSVRRPLAGGRIKDVAAQASLQVERYVIIGSEQMIKDTTAHRIKTNLPTCTTCGCSVLFEHKSINGKLYCRQHAVLVQTKRGPMQKVHGKPFTSWVTSHSNTKLAEDEAGGLERALGIALKAQSTPRLLQNDPISQLYWGRATGFDGVILRLHHDVGPVLASADRPDPHLGVFSSRSCYFFIKESEILKISKGDQKKYAVKSEELAKKKVKDYSIYTWTGAQCSHEDKAALHLFCDVMKEAINASRKDKFVLTVQHEHQLKESELFTTLFEKAQKSAFKLDEQAGGKFDCRIHYYHGKSDDSINKGSIWSSGPSCTNAMYEPQVTPAFDENEIPDTLTYCSVPKRLRGPPGLAAYIGAHDVFKDKAESVPLGNPLSAFCPKLSPFRTHEQSAARQVSETVVAICSSPEGHFMAVASARNVYIYDVQSGDEMVSEPIVMESDVQSVALAPKRAQPDTSKSTPGNRNRGKMLGNTAPTARILAVRTTDGQLAFYEFETKLRKTVGAEPQLNDNTSRGAVRITTTARLSELTKMEFRVIGQDVRGVDYTNFVKLPQSTELLSVGQVVAFSEQKTASKSKFKYGRVAHILPKTSSGVDANATPAPDDGFFLDMSSSRREFIPIMNPGNDQATCRAIYVFEDPANVAGLTKECEACTSKFYNETGVGESISDLQMSYYIHELAFSPDGTSLLVGQTVFPSGSKMPSSMINKTGHVAEWSRHAVHSLWAASGQIVRRWSTREQLAWKQENYTILDGALVTALSESSDCNAVAVGVTIDNSVGTPEASVWFPGEALRSEAKAEINKTWLHAVNYGRWFSSPDDDETKDVILDKAFELVTELTGVDSCTYTLKDGFDGELGIENVKTSSQFYKSGSMADGTVITHINGTSVRETLDSARDEFETLSSKFTVSYACEKLILLKLIKSKKSKGADPKNTFTVKPAKAKLRIPYPDFHLEERKDKSTVWEIEWVMVEGVQTPTLKMWTSLKRIAPQKGSAFLFWSPPQIAPQSSDDHPHRLLAWLGNHLDEEQISQTAQLFCQLASLLQKSAGSTDEIDKQVEEAGKTKDGLDNIRKELVKGGKLGVIKKSPAYELLHAQLEKAKTVYKTIKKESTERKRFAGLMPSADVKKDIQESKMFAMQGFVKEEHLTHPIFKGGNMPQNVRDAFCRRPDDMPAVKLISKGYGAFKSVDHIFLTRGIAPGESNAMLHPGQKPPAASGLAVERVQLDLPIDLVDIRKRMHGVFVGITELGQPIQYITASATPLEIAELSSAVEVTIKQGYGQAKADLSSTLRPEARWWMSVKATVEKSDTVGNGDGRTIDVRSRRMEWLYGDSKYGVALLDASSLNILRIITMGDAPSFSGLWLSAPVANVGFCGDGMATDPIMIISSSGNGFTIPASAPPGKHWLAATPVPISAEATLQQQLSTEIERGGRIEPMNRIIQKGTYGWIPRSALTFMEGATADGKATRATCTGSGDALMAPSNEATISFSFNAGEVVLVSEVRNTRLTLISATANVTVAAAMISLRDTVAKDDREKITKKVMDAIKSGACTQDEALRYLNIVIAEKSAANPNDSSAWVCISLASTRNRADRMATSMLPPGCWGGESLAAVLSSSRRLHFNFDDWRNTDEVSKICCSNARLCTKDVPCCAECTCIDKSKSKANANRGGLHVSTRTTRVVATASLASDASVHLCDPSSMPPAKRGRLGARVTGSSFQALPSLQAKLNFGLWDATGKTRTQVAPTVTVAGGIQPPLRGSAGRLLKSPTSAPALDITGKVGGTVTLNPLYNQYEGAAEDDEYLDVGLADDGNVTTASKFDTSGERKSKAFSNLPALEPAPSPASETGSVVGGVGSVGGGDDDDDAVVKYGEEPGPSSSTKQPEILASTTKPVRKKSTTSLMNAGLKFKRYDHKLAEVKDSEQEIDQLISKNDVFVEGLPTILSDKDRYWFEHLAPDMLTYMYLWSGESRKPDVDDVYAGKDNEVERTFFAEAQALGAVAQIMTWPDPYVPIEDKFENVASKHGLEIWRIERTENGKFVCVKKHNSEALNDTPQNAGVLAHSGTFCDSACYLVLDTRRVPDAERTESVEALKKQIEEAKKAKNASKQKDLAKKEKAAKQPDFAETTIYFFNGERCEQGAKNMLNDSIRKVEEELEKRENIRCTSPKSATELIGDEAAKKLKKDLEDGTEKSKDLKENLENFKNLFPAKNITLIERTENGKFVCVKKHNREALDDTPQNDTISKGSDPVYVAGRLSKTQITPGFMACFDAQPVEIVQHSASSAADRDFEFFSKTKSIKYEKRGNDSVKRLSDRRDGMKNEDIILAIAARVPKSPFEAPLADRVDDSRDVDDYSVTIHIDMKLVKFTKSGKIEQKSLGFTFGPSNAAELLDLKGEIFAVAPVHTAANPPPKTAISSEAPTMGEARVASSMAVGGILLAERQLKKGYVLKEIKPKGQDPIDVSQKDSDGVEEVLKDLQGKTDVSTHVELVFDMMLDLTSTNTDFLDFWEKKDDYIKKGEVGSNQSWHPTTFAAVLEIIIKAYPQKKKPLLLGESKYATAQALDIPGGGGQPQYTSGGVVTLDRSNGKKLGVRLGNAASLTEGIPILHVDPSGQAHGKFVAGDVVTSINGNSVLGLSMSKAAKFVTSSEQVDFELAAGAPTDPSEHGNTPRLISASLLFSPKKSLKWQDAPTKVEGDDISKSKFGFTLKSLAAAVNAQRKATASNEPVKPTPGITISLSDAMVLETKTEIYIWLPPLPTLQEDSTPDEIKAHEEAAKEKVDSARGALNMVRLYLERKRAAAAAAAAAAANTVTLDTVDGKSLGLSLTSNPATDGKGAAIKAVVPGGQAEATGKVFKGQMITHVNGIDVTGKTMKDIGAIIKGSNEATLRFRLLFAEGLMRAIDPPAIDPSIFVIYGGKEPVAFKTFFEEEGANDSDDANDNLTAGAGEHSADETRNQSNAGAETVGSQKPSWFEPITSASFDRDSVKTLLTFGLFSEDDNSDFFKSIVDIIDDEQPSAPIVAMTLPEDAFNNDRVRSGDWLVRIAQQHKISTVVPTTPPELTWCDLMEFAGEKGYARIQHKLGYVYWTGAGVEKDVSAARKWFEKAANQGYAPAQYSLGCLYFHGQGMEENADEATATAQAEKWFKKAAAQGDSHAHYRLGLLQSPSLDGNLAIAAFNDYKLAADQGHPQAQYITGCMYYEGKGVVKDLELALTYYRRAANQDNGAAQYTLGILFYNGAGLSHGGKVDELQKLRQELQKLQKQIDDALANEQAGKLTQAEIEDMSTKNKVDILKKKIVDGRHAALQVLYLGSSSKSAESDLPRQAPDVERHLIERDLREEFRLQARDYFEQSTTRGKGQFTDNANKCLRKLEVLRKEREKGSSDDGEFEDLHSMLLKGSKKPTTAGILPGIAESIPAGSESKTGGVQKWLLEWSKELPEPCNPPGMESFYLLFFERPSPTFSSEKGRAPPLFLAAKFGHDKLVQYLMTAKSANPNDSKYRNEHGQTPLATAAEHGHFNVVHALLTSGSTAKGTNARYDIADSAGLTALDVTHTLLIASSLTSRLPPLHFAVENGYVELARFLLKAGASVTSKGHGTKMTAIDMVKKENYLPKGKAIKGKQKESKPKDDIENEKCRGSEGCPNSAVHTNSGLCKECGGNKWLLYDLVVNQQKSKASSSGDSFVGELVNWESSLMGTLVGDAGKTMRGTQVFRLNPGIFFSCDLNGNTLLHHAAMDVDLQMTEDLLSADADELLVPKLWLTLNADGDDILSIAATALTNAYGMKPPEDHVKKNFWGTRSVRKCTCKQCQEIEEARAVSEAILVGIGRYLDARRFVLPPADNPLFMASMFTFVRYYPEITYPFVESLWQAGYAIPGLSALPTQNISVDSEAELASKDGAAPEEHSDRLKRSFLHKYASMSDEDQDKVFDMKHAQQLVDFKWKMFGQKNFNFEGILYLVLLFAFAVQSYFIVRCPAFNNITALDEYLAERIGIVDEAEGEDMGKAQNIDSMCNINDSVFSGKAVRIVPLVCLFAVVALSLRLLYREFKQVYFNGVVIYFADPWNWLDWIQLSIVGTTEIMYMKGDIDQQLKLQTIAAIATFVLWSQSLFYLRAFKSTGKFVSMVIAMVIDIKFFVLILGIFVLAHANAFFLLFAECDGEGCNEGWDTPGNIVYSSINMLIFGDFDLGTFDALGGDKTKVTRGLFIISEFMVAVVLLNLLIAIMGATYETISEKEDIEFYKLRASSLVELEAFLWKSDFKKGLYFPKLLPSHDMGAGSSAVTGVVDSSNDNRPAAATSPMVEGTARSAKNKVDWTARMQFYGSTDAENEYYGTYGPPGGGDGQGQSRSMLNGSTFKRVMQGLFDEDGASNEFHLQGEKEKNSRASKFKKQIFDPNSLQEQKTGEKAMLPEEAGGSGWGPKSGVWRIENIKDLAPVDKKEWGQFYAGDSYVVCYTYKTPGGKEAAFIYFWQGVESTSDEKAAAEIQATELADEIGSYAEMAKVEMNKEPPHFYKIFEGKFVVHGGGIGSGFENVDQADYNYDTDGVRLFQICGTNDWNTRAVQVAEKSSSLNSTDAFILETPNQLYAWFGKGCNGDERDFAKKIAPKLMGLTTRNKHPENISEGTEPADFWKALGGQTTY